MPHDHAHRGHHHHVPQGGDGQRRVFRAMLLTAAFMVAEVVGGVISGSLALLADAGHMLTDAASLLLAWLAFRISRRPADQARSYGYHRVQVLAAFVNGATLILIVGFIVVEALRRLAEPVPVMGGTMLAVATLGLVVNLVAFRLLHGGDQGNLNLRGATLHVLGDLMGSLAAIAGSIVILATGWTPIDPLLSLLVAGLLARSAWILVRQSVHILLEGTPPHIDIDKLKHDLMEGVPEVEEVHHVHAWSLTDERPMVTLHARVPPDADQQAVLRQIKARLRARFGVDHATIQLEPGRCADQEPAAKQARR